MASRRALELDSAFTCAHAILAQVYALTGHPDSALAELGLEPADGRAAWRGSGWRGQAARGRRAPAGRDRA